jgi:hypothetical protein
MGSISVRALIHVDVREVVEQQAPFNLNMVSIRPLCFPTGKEKCTEGISSPAQKSLMSSRTRQEQQWESASIIGVSTAAMVLAISLACVSSYAIAAGMV